MWVSQVWSPHPRQTCPRGTEQRTALITQGSCCHIVTMSHLVPRYQAVLSTPTVVGDDKSDNGSAHYTYAAHVPSETRVAASIPLHLWFSLCLFLFVFCFSLLFHVRESLWQKAAAARRTEIVNWTTVQGKVKHHTNYEGVGRVFIRCLWGSLPRNN